MTKTIEYIGAQQRWSELQYTGGQSVWAPGQIEERSDVAAAELIATGLFTEVQADLSNAELAAIRSVVEGDWVPIYIGPWATLLANYPAAAYTGRQAVATDQPTGTVSAVYSTGLYWRPVNGRALIGKSRLPMYVPQSSASLAANGAFTLAGSGLPFSSITGCWLYLPANTAATVAPAGWYYAVMSSATAGTLYQNTYDPTVSVDNSAPTSPTACTTANTGGWTGVTSEVTAFRVTVPTGMMGLNGEVMWTVMTASLGTTDTKTTKVKFGASTVTSSAQTSNTSYRATHRVWNMGQTNRQMAVSSVADGGSAGVLGTVLTVDTTAAVNIDVTLQISATTNNQSLGLHLFDLEFVG